MNSEAKHYKSLVEVGTCRICHRPLYIAYCSICGRLVKVGHYEQTLNWLKIHSRYNHGEDPR